jgi:hypothetical protein
LKFSCPLFEKRVSIQSSHPLHANVRAEHFFLSVFDRTVRMTVRPFF